MKIAVVGCGAMGSIYAALLASAGNEVFVVDANKTHVQAINKQGLRVWGASGDRTVKIEAFTKRQHRIADFIIVAVKSADVLAAVPIVQTMINVNTIVLTIQNGLGSSQQLAEIIGNERLMVGVAEGFGASLKAPGEAHHNAMKGIRMGRFAEAKGNKLSYSDVECIAELWRIAGFEVYAEKDIEVVQWEKLICNVAYSAPCALTGLTIGEVAKDPYVGSISRSAAAEALKVALLRKISLSFDDPIKKIHDFAIRMPGAKPSMLLDIEAGRDSEVDVINGAIPREAKKVGSDAPVNETLTVLVKSLESRR